MVEIIRKMIKWILLILLFILFIILVIKLAGNGSKKVKTEVKKNVEIIKEETKKDEDNLEPIETQPVEEKQPQEVNTPDTATNGTLEFIIGIIILSSTTYYIYRNRSINS